MERRITIIRRVAVPALLGALATGCVTTKEDGDLMRRDIGRLHSEQRAQAERNTDMEARLKVLEERSAQLNDLQKDLDERASRNRADFGAEVSALQQEVAGLRGQLETKEYQLRERELQLGASQQQVAGLETRLGELEKKVKDLELAKAAVPAAPPAPVEPPKPQMPTDRKGLYDFAKSAFDEGKFDVSREGFEKYQQAFPKDKELLDNTYYWTGESHFAEKKFDKAILAYQKVITDHPKSEKADAALYKMGMSFSALGYDDDARVFYDELLQKHPRSELIDETKARLAELAKKKKKPAKGKGKKR